MNEPITDIPMKTLAMEESLRKSRAMITYTSDRIRFTPPKGGKKKISINKTYATQLFHRERHQHTVQSVENNT